MSQCVCAYLSVGPSARLSAPRSPVRRTRISLPLPLSSRRQTLEGIDSVGPSAAAPRRDGTGSGPCIPPKLSHPRRRAPLGPGVGAGQISSLRCVRVAAFLSSGMFSPRYVTVGHNFEATVVRSRLLLEKKNLSTDRPTRRLERLTRRTP